MSDWSAHLWTGYARPSGAASFVTSYDDDGAGLGLSTPTVSDPNTGALSAASMPAVATPSLSGFSFVLGLFLLTMWLESGRRGGIL